MKMVQTVTGPEPSEEMGMTLIHEHLVPTVRSTSVISIFDYKRSNGRCLVDVTPIDSSIERSVVKLKELSEETGVYIIASTGFYKEPYLPRYLSEIGIDSIAELFIKDITEGMEGTGIKAGIIGEVGSSYKQITRLEEKVLRAAARAQRRTGAPLATHTTHGTMGIEQLQIFEEEGVDLNQVVIGHCDLNSDANYHLSIAQRGAYLGYDTIGKERWLSIIPGEKFAHQKDRNRIDLILEMLAKGFGDQIVVSSDIIPDELALNKETLGHFKYTYILIRFLPQLRDKGVSEEEINFMIKLNPQRLLAIRHN